MKFFLGFIGNSIIFATIKAESVVIMLCKENKWQR